MRILSLEPSLFMPVVELANQVHGDNYLDVASLTSMQQQGIKAGLNASFVALGESNNVVAYRLSFAPGQWPLDKWCSVQLWPTDHQFMAYFKSVAVAPSARGKGVASALLQASVDILRKQGARAGLAHIWRESPGNAAERYFSHAGARLLKAHPKRWAHLCDAGYICPLCGAACECSAAEMVLEFATTSDKSLPELHHV